MYLSSREVLEEVVRRMVEVQPEHQPIISLGIPRMILPCREMFPNPDLYVYELNPESAFNCQDRQNHEDYRAYVNRVLGESGWSATVRCDDLKWRVFSHRLDEVPHLLLLDTCNINTLQGARDRVKSQMRGLHPASVVLFNTLPERSNLLTAEHGTPAQRAARDLFTEPRLLSEVQYRGRGTNSRPRTLSFYTGR